jgi:hypothetical protein
MAFQLVKGSAHARNPAANVTMTAIPANAIPLRASKTSVRPRSNRPNASQKAASPWGSPVVHGTMGVKERWIAEHALSSRIVTVTPQERASAFRRHADRCASSAGTSMMMDAATRWTAGNAARRSPAISLAAVCMTTDAAVASTAGRAVSRELAAGRESAARSTIPVAEHSIAARARKPASA